ncbi:MAG: hypothetical protein HFH68_04320 [Lachnospiraceae bacterium]|nr:hypothetical protein [Lachnospiraceae bacterium]
MKKPIKLLPIAVICLSLCACSTNSDGTASKKEYGKTTVEKDNSKKQPETLDNTKEPEENTSVSENKNDDGTSPDLSDTDLNSQIKVKEYSYINSIDTTWYCMEVTNNSSVTVSIETNVTAKDKKGKTIGAASESEKAIEAGHTVCLMHMFYDTEPESYDYTLSVKEDEYYEPVLSDLSYEASDTGKKVIISCTNNGTEAAEFVEGIVLFFSGKKLLGHSSAYFTDDDSELKPGNTISKEFDYYNGKKYNNFKVYLTGRR